MIKTAEVKLPEGWEGRLVIRRPDAFEAMRYSKILGLNAGENAEEKVKNMNLSEKAEMSILMYEWAAVLVTELKLSDDDGEQYSSFEELKSNPLSGEVMNAILEAAMGFLQKKTQPKRKPAK